MASFSGVHIKQRKFSSKNVSLFFLCLITLLTISFNSFGQCPRSGAYFGEMVPNNGCGVFRGYSPYGPGEYFRMPVLQGASYSISTCGAPIDTQLTGYQAFNTAAGTHFFYVDDNGPICGGLQSSATFVPAFTDYARVQVSQFNCQPGGSSSITVNVRQNNNLSITSSAASMCQGGTRSLSATPTSVPSAPGNAGNLGTFSGTGVSGTTFTAPIPVGGSQTYTVTYTFGYCSTTQNIQVFREPTVSAAGPNQVLLLATNTALAGNTPALGTGSWSVVAGPGAVTAPSNPNSTITGLVAGVMTTVRWTISNGPCTSFDEMSINNLANLPVELGEFEVSAVDNESVDVRWMTVSEESNDYFLVERSKDLKSWEVTDKIQGAGNSTEQIYYRSLDVDPFMGVSYYRLKQIDVDGSINYSGIQVVELFPLGSIEIYPNPTIGELTVEGSDFEIATIQVFDLYGKEMEVEKVFTSGKCRLILNHLPKGMYLVRSRNYLRRIVKN